MKRKWKKGENVLKTHSPKVLANIEILPRWNLKKICCVNLRDEYGFTNDHRIKEVNATGE